jgi:hypothetical protein
MTDKELLREFYFIIQQKDFGYSRAVSDRVFDKMSEEIKQDLMKTFSFHKFIVGWHWNNLIDCFKCKL